MKNGAKKQTIFLTVINGVVRALGLILRVLLSRALGAEIMGIAELAQSAHMLAITPLTSGLPMAVSRITAKAKPENKERPLLAGISLVRIASLALIPLFLLLSPWIGRAMGDIRVLPSLWFSAPCILILGYSAVYNGYCYGRELSRIPALSELIEQAARLGISLLLIALLPRLTPPWLAAIPVVATMLAEVLGLLFVLSALKLPVHQTSLGAAFRRPIFRLAAPTTLTRIINTSLRSLAAIMIPLRLQVSGLSAVEAMSRLGMFNGMVMPILMLPCVFTSALSMVALPKLAQNEDKPKELKRVLLICFNACLGVAVISWAAVCWAAPFLANKVYRMAELSELFRLAAPLAFLFAFSHVSGGVIAALGQQKRSMYGALPVSVITLVLTWCLTAQPGMRLNGVIWAQMAGQLAAIVWNTITLLWWRRDKRRHAR